MPTLECLDERSRAILERLERMEKHLDENFDHFHEAINERNRIMDARLLNVENDILAIKLEHANERGRMSALTWIGGTALVALSSIFGAIGNIIYTWLTKPGNLLGGY